MGAPEHSHLFYLAPPPGREVSHKPWSQAAPKLCSSRASWNCLCLAHFLTHRRLIKTWGSFSSHSPHSQYSLKRIASSEGPRGQVKGWGSWKLLHGQAHLLCSQGPVGPASRCQRAQAAISLVFVFASVFSHLESMFYAALVGEESLNRLILNTF